MGDIEALTAVCRSVKARKAGDARLAQILRDEEGVNLDSAMQVRPGPCRLWRAPGPASVRPPGPWDVVTGGTFARVLRPAAAREEAVI